MVCVSESKPEVLVARRAADYGQHVGRARSRAHPGLGVQPLGQGKEIARDRLGAAELHRRADRVAQREFGAGGEPDTAAHWGEKITAFGVEYRRVQFCFTRRAVVHVVAALHG